MKIAFITDDTSLKIPPVNTEIGVLSLKEAEIEKIADYEAIILDARKIEEAKIILNSIRQSNIESVALKPVFLYNPGETENIELESLADRKTDLGRIAELVTNAESILKSISTLTEFKTEIFEIAVMLKILRFLYTRERKLTPLILPSSRYGYIYPILSSQFPDTEDFRIFEILSLMEQQGFLLGKFFDRVHLCNKCHNAFLNFREICPSCRSSNLSVENVIHHFPCGYVSPESKFTYGDQLICPKCNKILRHIGMDYEKPSSIFKCHSCQETFQEPLVECFCFHCKTVSPVEQKITRDIKSYELTPTGKNCAIYGIRFSLADFLKDKFDLVGYNDFKRMLTFENERKKRYKRESSIGFFQITNSQEIYMLIGERKNELAMEIARIIKENFRGSDVITALNESTFLILLPETTTENSKIVLGRVKTNIENLLRSNFHIPGKTFVPQISVNIVPVNESSLNNLFPE